MDSRGTFVTLAALALFGCSVAVSPSNIFGVEYGESINNNQLHERLTSKLAPDIKEVAVLLAITRDKNMLVEGKVKVRSLLKMAEMSARIPALYCDGRLMDQYKNNCKQVSANAPLSSYCNYCLEKQLNNCAQIGSEAIFDHIVEYIDYPQNFRAIMSKLSSDINGSTDESLEVRVGSYLSKISEEHRNDLEFECRQFLGSIEDDLLYFDKEARSKLTDQQRDTWDQCLAVEKLRLEQKNHREQIIRISKVSTS